jgi:hypothetical protein
MNEYLRGSCWEDDKDELPDIVDCWYLESSCSVLSFRIVKLTKL